MTDLFIPIWLALGFLLSIGSMFGMAILTKSGPMALSPLVAFAPFMVATMGNDHQKVYVVVGVSLMAFYVSWLVILAAYMIVDYARSEQEPRNISR